MKNDGGSAFPFLGPHNTVGDAGMSLRDYFAASVLSGGLEQGIEDDMNINWWHEPQKLARRAYAVADAMLAEREK